MGMFHWAAMCSSTGAPRRATPPTPASAAAKGKGATAFAAGKVLSVRDAANGAKRLKYRIGPFDVKPGQNEIGLAPVLERPQVDGYFTRIRPDLTYLDGTVPGVDVIHLHHGVWLNLGRRDATAPFVPERFFATFTDLGDGVKAGIHHEGEVTTPAAVRRTISAEEDAMVRALVERVLPDAAGRQVESRVCLYTNTPDGHFVIDRHPAHDEVTVLSPCSGHGFKFASAIGEIAADLVLDGGCRFDLEPFRLARFSPARASVAD